MTTITAHPWRLFLADGTEIGERHRARYAGLFARTDIRAFQFVTPSGVIGVNHETGSFSVFGATHRHPLYRAGNAYRHWHRVGRFSDFDAAGGPVAAGVSGYSLGMERTTEDGAREILFLEFPHEVASVGDVMRCMRLSYPPGTAKAKTESRMALVGST